MTTLTKGADVLTLPDDLLWTDEFDFEPVQAETSYTMHGALVVNAGLKLAGRPMTLEAGDDYGWITRATLFTLEAWRLLPGQALTLTYRGTAHNVLFDHARDALQARALIDYADPVPQDFYIVTLRFLKVTAP